MDDASMRCKEWSDRKLYAELDHLLMLSIDAPTASLRLGYLGGARGLLGILADRAMVAIPVKDD